jgi:hypothetical protein
MIAYIVGEQKESSGGEITGDKVEQIQGNYLKNEK